MYHISIPYYDLLQSFTILYNDTKFFLQVTQLDEETLSKIILTRNSLPLNPLLVLVGIYPFPFKSSFTRLI